MLFQFLLSTIHFLYIIITLFLSIYSLNVIILTLLFWLRKALGKPVGASPTPDMLGKIDWPVVAVQLPMYNENEIAVRIIDRIVELDYPRDQLHIQILDDSTDDTARLVAERVAYWQQQGVWITLHHRRNRIEYKAGALREALEQTPASFIAVFDADFMPSPDWLKKALFPFFAPGNQRLGYVQTRWDHLNDKFSLITRAQALALDGHFGIEQTVCSDYGFILYLNGTGLILRRECILDAGNWSGETLVEDLDLSYRAQIKGWKGIFLRDVSAPAEIPGLFGAFKSQQFRWSKGSVQVLRRLAWKILTSPLPLHVRWVGLVHLAGYSVQAMMLLLILLTLPLYLWSNAWLLKMQLNGLGIIGLGVPLFYISAHLTLHPPKRWLDLLVNLPALSIVGIGIAANNTLGVFAGLGNAASVFERTPKMGVTNDDRIHPLKMQHKLKISKAVWLEVAITIYALITTLVMWNDRNLAAVYFFAIYVLGFSGIAIAELLEAAIARRVQKTPDSTSA